jgi:hypothetical protein
MNLSLQIVVADVVKKTILHLEIRVLQGTHNPYPKVFHAVKNPSVKKPNGRNHSRCEKHYFFKSQRVCYVFVKTR